MSRTGTIFQNTGLEPWQRLAAGILRQARRDWESTTRERDRFRPDKNGDPFELTCFFNSDWFACLLGTVPQIGVTPVGARRLLKVPTIPEGQIERHGRLLCSLMDRSKTDGPTSK